MGWLDQDRVKFIIDELNTEIARTQAFASALAVMGSHNAVLTKPLVEAAAYTRIQALKDAIAIVINNDEKRLPEFSELPLKKQPVESLRG